jgi:hypothetical protein
MEVTESEVPGSLSDGCGCCGSGKYSYSVVSKKRISPYEFELTVRMVDRYAEQEAKEFEAAGWRYGW